MTLSQWVRQIHRWVSVAFYVTVIACFVSLGVGEPPMWLFYTPLLPLAFLSLSGLYLFVLPYANSWRSARRSAAR